jgi:hypothetical protein
MHALLAAEGIVARTRAGRRMGARLRRGTWLLASWRAWARLVAVAAAVAVALIVMRATGARRGLGCGTLTIAITIMIARTPLTPGTTLLLPMLRR